MSFGHICIIIFRIKKENFQHFHVGHSSTQLIVKCVKDFVNTKISFSNKKKNDFFTKKMLKLFQMCLKPIRKVKYRQKCIRYLLCIYLILTILLIFCAGDVYGKCTDVTCMNGGVCGNGTCVCADGWQGDECQFCGGKVRFV